MPKQTIAIIGAGNLGSALAAILGGTDADIRVWDRDPSRNPGGLSAEAALDGAAFAFFCVPSWAVRSALEEFAPRLGPATTAVGMSKGIEAEGKRTMDELLAELLPAGRPWAILSGPMLAAELSAGKAGAAVAASPDVPPRAALAALFAGTRLLVEESPDAHGVALCGVLKNVYAVGLGIGQALGWADNLRGWYASRAIRECMAILSAQGCEAATVLGAAGIGDLVATGFSPSSRNRRYGEEIVRHGSCPFTSEGCASLPYLLDRLGDLRGRLPALDAVVRVVIAREKAADAFGGLYPRE